MEKMVHGIWVSLLSGHKQHAGIPNSGQKNAALRKTCTGQPDLAQTQGPISFLSGTFIDSTQARPFLYPGLNLLLQVSVSVRSINVTKSACQHGSRSYPCWFKEPPWLKRYNPPLRLYFGRMTYCTFHNLSVELARLWFWKNKLRTPAFVVWFNVWKSSSLIW